MEIVLARHQGFCGGVKRAVEMAGAAASRYPKGVRTWGPLIHNPQVVRRLEEAGVRVAESVEELDGEALVVSAYGVEQGVLEAAANRGMVLIDATCPVVKRAHMLASRLAEEGYQVVAVGDHGHPEMLSLKEALGDSVTVVNTPAEASRLDLGGRVGVVSQTTQSLENFRAIVGDLSLRTKELKVHNTLCPAITLRQEEARGLVRRVDALVVVGGHRSSNTTRLAEIGRAAGLPTHHIETSQELQGEWFASVGRIGVVSGASTPEWVIAEVVGRLRQIGAALEASTAPVSK